MGVRLDQAALGRMHREYLECSIQQRDGAWETRKCWPEFGSAKARL